MPEPFSWSLAGYLVHSGFPDMAIYQVALFESIARPSALLDMRCSDIVVPSAGGMGFYALLLAPFERERATKTGYHVDWKDWRVWTVVGAVVAAGAGVAIGLSVSGKTRAAEEGDFQPGVLTWE